MRPATDRLHPALTTPGRCETDSAPPGRAPFHRRNREMDDPRPDPARFSMAQARLTELISSVRMEEHLSLCPTQLSGGLEQRVAIARAFAGDRQGGRQRRADL